MESHFRGGQAEKELKEPTEAEWNMLHGASCLHKLLHASNITPVILGERGCDE
jgi:hypothetical protein